MGLVNAQFHFFLFFSDNIMQVVNDNHLAYLLSLGFELELCQQALRDNATLEDATEWYVISLTSHVTLVN